MWILALALLAPHPAGPQDPEAPTGALRLTFEEETRFSLRHMSADYDGQTVERENVSLVGVATRTQRWQDGPRRGESGVEGEGLERRWEQLELELECGPDTAGADSSRANGASELEGKSVPLAQALDFGVWLPEGGLAGLVVGDSWKLPPAVLALALRPAGEVPLWADEKQGMRDPDQLAYTASLSAAQAAASIEGEVQATWKGVEEATGHGRIVLSVDVGLASEITAWMHEQGEPFPMAAICRGARDAHLEAELVGNGQLLWNLEAGRPESIELQTSGEFRVDYDYRFEHRGVVGEGGYGFRFEAEVHSELRFEPVVDPPAAGKEGQAALAGSMAAGRSVAFEAETSQDCRRFKLLHNGDLIEREDYVMQSEHLVRRSWVDRDLSEKDGAPAGFAREFQGLPAEMSYRMTEITPEENGFARGGCGLQGRSVTFPWDPAVHGYGAAQGTGARGGDGELLAGLRPMADDSVWLPAGRRVAELQVGERWPLPASLLRSLLRPGGVLPVHYSDLEGMRDPDTLAFFGGLDCSSLAEVVTGDLQAEWLGPDTAGGAGRLGLRFEVDLERDLTERIILQAQPFPMAAVARGASNARASCELAGSATLRWDLTQDRLLGAELSAAGQTRLRFDFDYEIAGLVGSGDYAFEFDTEARLTLELRKD